MAVVYPAANDNWSTVANWMSGGNPYGQLPQSGDIVCSNGKTVTIDMDLAVYTFDRLTTVATSPAAAGGGFTMGISGIPGGVEVKHAYAVKASDYLTNIYL